MAELPVSRLESTNNDVEDLSCDFDHKLFPFRIPEIMLDIIKFLPDEDLPMICQSCRRVADFCDTNFWRHRFSGLLDVPFHVPELVNGYYPWLGATDLRQLYFSLSAALNSFRMEKVIPHAPVPSGLPRADAIQAVTIPFLLDLVLRPGPEDHGAEMSEISHEYNVGMELNTLTRIIPNFVTTYGRIDADGPIYIDRRPVTWLQTDINPITHLVQEFLPGAIRVVDYTPKLTLILALQEADRQIGFFHGDLTTANVLIRKVGMSR